VQWQVNTGSGFTDIGGATSNTLTILNPTVAMNGYQYQAVFTNSCTPGTATSTSATLTVNPAPLGITANNQTKTYGTAFTFTGSEFSISSGTLYNGDMVTSVSLSSAGSPATASVAGSPYTIVPSAAVFSTGTASNYSISYVNGSFTVNPAPLDITANNQTKTYGTAFTFTGTEISTGAGQLKNGDMVTSVSLSSAGSPATAGVAGSPYTIVPSGAVFSPGTASNYSINYVNGSFTVDPAPLGITANNQTKTYGTAFTFTGSEFTVSSGTLYNGDTVTSVTLTSGGAAATAGVAGSPYSIVPSGAVFSPGTDSNYSISYINGSFTVDPAPLGITANNQTKTYGTAFTFTGSEFTVSSGTLYNGDMVASVTLTSGGAAATAGVVGSPYSIVPSAAVFSPGAASNYSISYVDGSFTVNPAPLGITADNQTKTYGTAFTFTGSEFTVSSGTLYNGDMVASVTLTSAGAPATANVVGSPYAIQASAAMFSPGAASNYSISYVDGSFTVDPAPLTITATNESKTYGVTFTPNGTTQFTASGLLFSDSVTSVTLTSSGYVNTAPVSGSPYAITPSAAMGTGLGNYTISYVDGTLTVNPAPLTITATNQSKTYGQTFTPDGMTQFTASGLLFSDSVTSVTLASSGYVNTAPVSGSPYAITPSAAMGTGLGNYTISYVNGTLTVNTAPLTITATNQSKTYGMTFTPDGTTQFTASGLLFSDSVTSVTLSSSGYVNTATVTAPGPDYAIVPSAAVGSGLGNYTIGYVSGTLHINPKPLDITANNRTKTYGDTVTFAGTEFTTGAGQLVNGNTVTSVTLTSAGAVATASVSGSPYTITPSAAVGTGLGNYTISYHNAAIGLTVNPAPLTITADSIVGTPAVDPFIKVYDGLVYTGFTVRYDGFVNGETPSVLGGSLSFSGAGTTAVLPGTYTVTPGGLTSVNYTITFVNGTLKITFGTCTGSTPGGVILPPINSDGTSVYKRKAGSTIPVKFTVCGANGQPISDPYAVFLNYPTGGQLTMLSERRGTIDNVNEAGTNDVPDVAFTFSGDHWQFNMATTNLNAPSTYTYKINLADGSGITFVVGTK